jgi:hypothetical protein
MDKGISVLSFLAARFSMRELVTANDDCYQTGYPVPGLREREPIRS